MPSRVAIFSYWVAAVALSGMAQRPAMAGADTMTVAMCGGHAGASLPPVRIPKRSHRDCPVGCHAACAGRKKLFATGNPWLDDGESA